MTRLIVLFGLFFLVDTTAVSAQAAEYTDHMRTAISLNQQLVQQIVVAQSTFPTQERLDNPAPGTLPLLGGLLVVAGVLLRFRSRPGGRMVVGHVRNRGPA
jgi:hypothetical protein